MKISKKWDKGKIFIILTSISYIIFFLFMATNFRIVRDKLPSPKIDESGVVGYSQYFGYPFFIDTVIFFVMVLIPLISFIALKLLYRANREKK